ncbi:MAG: HAD family phosphatase [Rubrivivax sp.]|nr:HAD family phosphatase [Rubrivivax sp.]
MAHAIEALLFDLDGTVIDSMPLHHAAWAAWFTRRGLPFDDAGFFAATAGRTNAEILAEFFPALDDAQRWAMAEDKEGLYREEAERSLQLVAGFAAVPALALAHGLKLAICTAAPLANIEVAVRRFGLDGWAQTITSPADGLRGKPHPDIFLEAARRLGVAPANCLVFEDAPLGVEAARRAGMAAVALTTSLPAAAFTPYPNLRCTMADFLGLDLQTLVPTRPMRESPHA